MQRSNPLESISCYYKVTAYIWVLPGGGDVARRPASFLLVLLLSATGTATAAATATITATASATAIDSLNHNRWAKHRSHKATEHQLTVVAYRTVSCSAFVLCHRTGQAQQP